MNNLTSTMVSYFPKCESCGEAAKRACNCSSPSRLFCDKHAFDHMNSEQGIHPFEQVLQDLSDQDISNLKQALQQYYSESIRQAISARNNIITSLLQNIRKAEQEYMSFIKSVLNGEIKRCTDLVISNKSIPLSSSSTFLNSLLSLKQSRAFSLPNISKEISSFSPSISYQDPLFSSNKYFFKPQASGKAEREREREKEKEREREKIEKEKEKEKEREREKIEKERKREIEKKIQKEKEQKREIERNREREIKSKTRQDSKLEKEKIIEKQGEDEKNNALQIPQWDLSHQIEAHTRNSYLDIITCLALSDCKRYLASSSYDKTIKIWDARNWKLIQCLRGHTHFVTSVCFFGNKIVSGSGDKSIKIWEDLRCVSTLFLHSDCVTSVCVSSNKRFIASGSNDQTAIVFDIESSRTLHTLRSHTDWITSVVFTVGDGEIVSASGDRSIKIWKTETGELLRTLSGHSRAVFCIRISGSLMVSSSGDNSIRIWEKDREESLLCLLGHTGIVSSIDIYNNMVVSIGRGADESIRIWDITSEKQINALPGNVSFTYGMRYTGVWIDSSLKILEEGRCIVWGGEDGRIKIWRERQLVT